MRWNSAAHFSLIIDEALVHVPRTANVHSRFPEVEQSALHEVAFRENAGADSEVEYSIGNQGNTVHFLNPLPTHPPDDFTGHQRVDVAVSKDYETSLQGGKDVILELIRKVGRIKEGHCHRA